jgi:glucose/arabinose dehydrogenase
MIAFGPDGNFYVGLGDGGGSGDPFENAQDPFHLLGKILRVDVDSLGPYAIPPDNPFADDALGAPEVFLLGLRNPWRFSFDGNDIWIGDVGQNGWEEIDRVPLSAAGANFGWDRLEGTHCYQGSAAECADPAYTPPVYEYPHDGGRCSVTGGYVYRGNEIPGLVGAYLFSDWCTGGLRAIRVDETGAVVEEAVLAETGWRFTSFGVDLDGELYFTRADGVFRVVATP